MIHIAYLGAKILIYLAWEAEMALLLAKKVNVLKKYSDFSDVFSNKSAVILSDSLIMNKHAIDLESDKQPSYSAIYSLGLVKL